MNIALILSGGAGERLRVGIPKQYLRINKRPLISYCLEVFFCHEEIDAVHIVASNEWRELILEQILGIEGGRSKSRFSGFSRPGAMRQLSIFNGLEDLLKFASPGDMVMIHDAARPLISGGVVSACLKAAAGHDGAVPVLPMKDSVYLGDGYRITSLLERKRVFAGQAPECFLLGAYYEANRRLLPNEILRITGSAEPAVLAGMDIALTAGDEMNFKITTREDLLRFRQILEDNRGR